MPVATTRVVLPHVETLDIHHVGVSFMAISPMPMIAPNPFIGSALIFYQVQRMYEGRKPCKKNPVAAARVVVVSCQTS